MKTVNQVVTIAVLLLLLVLLPIVATVPDAVVSGLQSFTSTLEPWVMTTVGRVVTGVVAALLWLVVIWLLWREVRGTGDKNIRVAEVEEGRARVSESSVAKLLERRVSAVPDVKGVNAKVRQSAKEGVVAELTLTTIGEVRVPDVTRNAIESARTALETEIGAKVARVDVRVKEVGTSAGVTMAPLAASTIAGQAEPLASPAPAASAPAWSAHPEEQEVTAPETYSTWSVPEPKTEDVAEVVTEDWEPEAETEGVADEAAATVEVEEESSEDEEDDWQDDDTPENSTDYSSGYYGEPDPALDAGMGWTPDEDGKDAEDDRPDSEPA